MTVILQLILLCGGLAFFMFGMDVMSSGLEKMAGGKLESSLKKMTSNKFKCILLGAGITIAIQSSSAMTVMLVGLVNSGIMQLGQTIGVIMGSNIGTTLTAWILSLSGLEGDSFMALLKPENFSLVLALIGIVFNMFSKSDKKKSLGSIFVGFAVLIYGMELMSQSMEPLAESEAFANMLVMFKNPIFGVLVGAVVTGVIQSSAASVGILMTLAIGLADTANPITFGMAIPIIMGQNIGTCVTALISSIGVNRNARRVAVVHVSFNVIGTVVCLTIYYIINALFHLPFTDLPVTGFGISLVHSIFNIVTTAMLLPFTKQLEKIAYFVIKDKDDEKHEEFTFIDYRLLSTPSIAVGESINKANEMCGIAFDSITESIELFKSYDETKAKNIIKYEDEIDIYEDKLGTYLVKLSREEMTTKDSYTVSKLLHAIGDFERIGDHAVNLLKVAEELKDKGLKFSQQASEEIEILSNALFEILSLTRLAFQTSDVSVAKKVEPLEQVVDRIIKKIRTRHIERLSQGVCTLELGFVLADLLNNFERVSDHCSNIAVAIIEIDREAMDTHEYLNAVKYSDDKEFNEAYEEYKTKYYI
ncbi:MAG: Na/Pi cotransporter family protein [Acutalibacteraceae bacterium]|nr:Na/Pi cotransporter family protein [Acutalibacteraceae bacterium]